MRYATRLYKRLFARSCRAMARLISESQERRLRLGERVLLRMHLSVCDACTRFRKQVKFMSRAMGRWKQYSEEP
jgi:hypothetical protein